MSFATVYPLYVNKVEKKGHTKAEVDQIIRWLTGYSQQQLDSLIKNGTDFETFIADAPKLNPSRKLITGVICGIREDHSAFRPRWPICPSAPDSSPGRVGPGLPSSPSRSARCRTTPCTGCCRDPASQQTRFL